MQDLTREQGAFELTLLNAEYAGTAFDDVLVEGLNLGIPAEIMTRLESIWGTTRTVAGEIVAVGKIIVSQIFAFFRANPGITIGIALGAAVGALTTAIPFIGPLLAPVAASAAMFAGAGIGATFDAGVPTSDPLIAAIQLARKFFELLRNILWAVREYFATA